MSSILIRLVEKITGRPHVHRNAEKVVKVAENLKREVAQLSASLKPYTEADDPLAALMEDVYNNKQTVGPRAVVYREGRE